MFRRRDFIHHEKQPIVRLPWLKVDALFEDLCTRCDQCIVACAEHIIAKDSGGFPRLDFKQGECTFCAQCVDVCEVPELFDRQQPAFSHQLFITESCLPKVGVACQSCGDVCQKQALQFHWNAQRLREPQLSQTDCNQCGACIRVCPADAISIQLTAQVTK